MDHEIKQVEVEAYLYSKQEPTPQQQERLKQFLADKYQKEVGKKTIRWPTAFVWKWAPAYISGT